MIKRDTTIKIITFLLIIIESCTIANKSNDQRYLGTYSSVTESECNMEIVLNSAGQGKAIQTCRLEDGTHKDVKEETPFKWKIITTSIFINYSNKEIELVYDQSLSTHIYGGTKPLPGLVLKTKGNNIFGGYGDKFWKKESK